METNSLSGILKCKNFLLFQRFLFHFVSLAVQKFGVLFFLHHTQNSTQKWMKDLKIDPEMEKLLEENTGEDLHDLGFGSNFHGYNTNSPGSRSKGRHTGLSQASFPLYLLPFPVSLLLLCRFRVSLPKSMSSLQMCLFL